MARTSRKGAARQQAAPSERVWNAAVYARLSLEDSGRKGADTIETQIELVASYIKERPHLSLHDTYIDNGASGKDFERPAWQRLMDDIRAGRVDCVCVKDLSRFSRDYIETCEFLEKIFPFMGVRFISVNDGYDNNAPGDHNEGLIVALKSLINDQYIRDISRKICSSVKARRERGEYTRGIAPFGYRKMSGQRGVLEPDPAVAPVIREIFSWRAEGMSHGAICKRLEEQSVPTPAEYLRRAYNNGEMFTGSFFKSTIWRVQTLKGILGNPVYIGTVVTGKENQRLYERKPCTNVPRDQWIVTENAHEPIVNYDLWEAVQTIEMDTRRAYTKSGRRPERTENIFKGFIVCGSCGSKMSRSYSRKDYKHGGCFEQYYFICPIHRQHEEQPVRSVREDVIYRVVFRLVRDKLLSAANLAELIEKRLKRQSNPRAALDAAISRAAAEREKISERLVRLYEDYADELLTEQEYARNKARYEIQAESLRRSMDELSKQAAVLADLPASDNRWLKAARSFQNPAELTREMLEAIVERVVVSGPDKINVVWNFRDELALLEACALDGEGVA